MFSDNTVSEYIYHINVQSPRSDSATSKWCLVISACCTSRCRVNCSSRLSQRGNGFQEHDRALWLGQEAHAGEGGPAPAGDPNHHHLRLAVQRGQQLGEHHQNAEATISCGDNCKYTEFPSLRTTSTLLLEHSRCRYK